MIKIFGSKPWMPVRISVKPCPYTIYSEVFVFPFITSLYVVKVWVESNWMGGFHSERHLHERVAAWNWKSQAPELLFLRRSLSDTNTITVTDTNTNTKHRYKYICMSEWRRGIERVKRQNYCSLEYLCQIQMQNRISWYLSCFKRSFISPFSLWYNNQLFHISKNLISIIYFSISLVLNS